MTSLGRRCHTAHLDAAEITVGFLSVAASNVASSIDFSDTDLITARLSTGAMDLGDYEVSAPSGGAFAIKDAGGSVRLALSSGGAFLHGYQPQLTVGGASIPDVVLNTFNLNLDDDPSLSNSLVTAGAISHYIENDLQPVLLTAPAGSQGGVRASAISLTTPSSLNVPSCRAVLELMNNQETTLFRGLIGVGSQIANLNTVKIPILQESLSVNSTLIDDLDGVVGELGLSVANNYAGLIGVGLQIASINGEKIPALQESISVNGVLAGGLGETLSLNALSLGQLALSLGAARAVADHNTAKTNLLGTLYSELETSISALDTTLSLNAVTMDGAQSDISVNKELISALDTTLSLNTVAVEDAQLDISVNNSLISTLDTALSVNTVAVEEAQLDISVNNNLISALVTSLSLNTVAVEEAQLDISVNNSLIFALDTALSLNAVAVEEAQLDISVNNSLISALDTAVSVNTVAVEEAQLDISVNNNLISALVTSLSLNTVAVEEAQLDISVNKELISTLDTSLSSLSLSVGNALSVQKAIIDINTAAVVSNHEVTLSVASTYTPLSVSNHLSNRISSVSSTQNQLIQTVDQAVVDVDELQSMVIKHENATKLAAPASINLSVDSLLCAQFNNNRILLNATKVYHQSETVENELLPRGTISSLISDAVDDFNNSSNSASFLSIGAELTSAQQAISVNAVDLSTSAEIVSELYLSVGDLADSTLSLGAGLDAAKNDIDTLEGVSSATLNLVISIGSSLSTANASIGSLDAKLSVHQTQISLNANVAVEAQALAVSVAALDLITREAAENDFLGVDAIASKFKITGEGDPTVYTLESDSGTAIHVYNRFSDWSEDAFYGDADAVLKSNTSFATTKWTLEKDLAAQAGNDLRYGTLSVQQLLDQRVTVLEEGGGGANLISTVGNSTKVSGVAAINLVTAENNSTCARFKTDRVELLQDVHLNHINDGQATRLISTDDLIVETPGGLYKDSVAAENEYLRKSDIEALITQRLNSALLVTDQVGLPSSTGYTVTRSEAGEYVVVFADSWNAQFPSSDYAVTLSQRSRSLSTIPSPAKFQLFWYNKTNAKFHITNVEREDTFQGTNDVKKDAGVIDFTCTRGLVTFCQGSFRGGAIGTFGPL